MEVGLFIYLFFRKVRAVDHMIRSAEIDDLQIRHVMVWSMFKHHLLMFLVVAASSRLSSLWITDDQMTALAPGGMISMPF